MNGLNQYTAAGSASFGYDDNGNLISDGTNTWLYDHENRLVGAGAATLAYDPLGRLFSLTSGSTTTTFLYDGGNLVAEYNGATMLRRHLHWGALDTPAVTFDGAGFTQPHWLHADERGSIVASSDGNGAATINTYDEQGIPGAGNSGRFGFTGQLWLPEIGLYYYRARIYSPTLGRFLQTDPIGYAGGMNLYAYVHNDPVNFTDPLGLDETITVTGPCMRCDDPGDPGAQPGFRTVGMVPGGPTVENTEPDILVRGIRPPRPRPGVQLAQLGRGIPRIAPWRRRTPRQAPETANFCNGSPDSIGGIDISAACARHDFCYGSSTSRIQCDRDLRDGIWDECVRQHSQNPGCYAGAFIYYRFVRSFGQGNYEGSGDRD